MTHLIILSATIPEDKCLEYLGYSYKERMKDYRNSFQSALLLKDFFSTISIIECIAKHSVKELESSAIEVYYSNFNNSYKNKGINEVLHIYDFLKNYRIADNDTIVKLTGRYNIVSNSIINLGKNDIVAKYDGDIYPGDKGVHTFLYKFKKSSFNKFVEWLDISNNNTYDNVCIEWLLKDFMELENIPILNNNTYLGVTTCLYNKDNKTWLRKTV